MDYHRKLWCFPESISKPRLDLLDQNCRDNRLDQCWESQVDPIENSRQYKQHHDLANDRVHRMHWCLIHTGIHLWTNSKLFIIYHLTTFSSKIKFLPPWKKTITGKSVLLSFHFMMKKRKIFTKSATLQYFWFLFVFFFLQSVACTHSSANSLRSPQLFDRVERGLFVRKYHDHM